jgi:hypothetical protein
VYEKTHENHLGGKMVIRHELDLSGQCFSIDHVAEIDSVRCDPTDARVSIKFVDGALPPKQWRVGAVLLGSPLWRCAPKTMPDERQNVRMVEGEYDAFVRRIMAVEHDEGDNEWHFIGRPEQGSVCLDAATVRMKTHRPAHLSTAEYMTLVEEVRYCVVFRAFVRGSLSVASAIDESRQNCVFWRALSHTHSLSLSQHMRQLDQRRKRQDDNSTDTSFPSADNATDDQDSIDYERELLAASLECDL